MTFVLARTIGSRSATSQAAKRAIQIDPLLVPVMPFIEDLETECYAACCGIQAFSLLPDDISKAITKLGRTDSRKLIAGLSAAQNEIGQLHTDTVVSTRIKQYFRKEVFLEILAHIRAVIGDA